MRTDVYALEIEPHDRPVSETGHQSNRTEQYQYTVELDANGEIVGVSGSLRVRAAVTPTTGGR